MNIVAVIQARLGSSRLPGKVLADLGGRSMLARVVRRTARASLIDRVVVAAPDLPSDDPIAAECKRLDTACFRGSEEDVLDRYMKAADRYRADVVVRITSDCPLIDPTVIDRTVRAFLDEQPDYASNVLERTYPRGLDTEVMAVDALRQAWQEAVAPHERTHVTPYIHQHPDRFRLVSVTHAQDFSRHRWTVDMPEDLELVRGVYERFGLSDDMFSWLDAAGLLESKPELAELNRHVRQKELTEG